MGEIFQLKREIIKFCRQCRGLSAWTQKELSERCGIHYSTLSLFENGRFSFDVARAYYVNVMDVDQKSHFCDLIDDLKEAYLFN